MAGLRSLTQLDIGDNELEDVSDLRRLTSLTYLGLYSNDIEDVSALRGMTSLADVRLNNNRISDISDLAANDGLGQGDYLDLLGNPLDDDAHATHIPALQERGVTVYFDPPPAVEISDRALRRCFEQALGKERGAAIAESEMASLTSLTCRNAGVADLSSLEEAVSLTKLELDGNEIEDVDALGELESLLYVGLRDNSIADIEALADNRDFGDGDYIELRGNPLNAEAHSRHIPALERRGVTVSYDPSSPPVSISDAALRQCLEEEFDKEAGATITEDDMASLDRLYCDRREGRVADISGLEFAVNLDFLALVGSDVSDLSPLADLASLTPLWLGANAVDDLSPLAELRSLTHLGLASNEIEDVSDLRRLTSLTYLGLTDNEIEDISDLRRLTSLTFLGLALNRASAYIEASDGLFGSFHECVSAASTTADAQPTHEVLLFNSAGHQDGASRLRLINSAGAPANVRIRGIDDAGRPGVAVVRLAIPAGATRELTASDLETGEADGVSGALGDGGGKWRLRVESDAPIEVMNLVETASGHLSTSPAETEAAGSETCQIARFDRAI